MNKITTIIKTLMWVTVMAFILTGCGIQSPTAVVEASFKEISKGTNGELAKYFIESLSAVEADPTTETTQYSDAQQQTQTLFFSQFQGQVLSETIDGETASVAVEVNSLNMAEIILASMGAAMGAAFSGSELTDEVVEQLILEQFETAQVQTRTGNIALEKIDGQWKIDTASEDFATLIFGEINFDK